MVFRKMMVVLAICVCAGPVWAGFYWEAKLVTEAPSEKGGRNVIEQKNYYSGRAMRMEGGNEATIFLMDKGVIYTIDHGARTYTETSVTDLMSPEGGGLQEMMQEMMKQIKVEETGETREILGHESRKYVISFIGNTIEHWVTDDFEEFNKLQEESRKHLDKFGENSVFRQFGLGTTLDKVKGFPMATKSSTLGVASETTVTKAEVRDLEESLFVVPADYTKKEFELPFAGGR